MVSNPYAVPGPLIATVIPVVVLFGGWDLLGERQGDWWYSTHYTLGWRLLGLPVEEWLFFLVVPTCAVLTYEAFGRTRPGWTGRACRLNFARTLRVQAGLRPRREAS